MSPASLWKELWARLPRTIPGWLRAVGSGAALVSVPAMIAIVVSPLVERPWTLGQRNWDQMDAHRYVVLKSLLRFHQFPFWDPWSCGGHAAWGAQESAPIVISPFLPVYLWLPYPIALRVEILGWAVVGATGAWMLARRFTKSVAVAALVVLAFAVDSRWSMQVAVGHSWHLLYALMPWALYFFDRGKLRDLVLAAACIALMVYGDAIYPVPHTAFVLVVYACVTARATRSWRPVGALAVCGALAAGLSAPKLLPLWEQMQRFPRYIKSEEAIWPWRIPDLLTLRLGDYTAVSSWTVGMWHEWGLYLGWPLLLAIVAGVLASRGPRERALTWAGVAMVVFVIGGFHALAPWRLMHLLPVFKSQHVPSRWLYPAVLVLGCAAASGAERLLGRAGPRRAFFEVLLGVGAVACAVDMGLVARQPIADSFNASAPEFADSVKPFHVVHRLEPSGYAPKLWDVATLPGVIDNVGTMECVTFAGYHITLRDMFGRMPGLGAWGEEDADYRGEAYVAEGDGSASITSWTPNEVVVSVRGARAGDHLVLNQNWDSGWSADGAPAIAYRDAVATTLGPASQVDGSWSVRFWYRPRTFGLGCAVFVATAAGIALLLARARTKRTALLALPLATLGCSGEPPRHVVDRIHGPTAPASAACDPARAPFRFPTARGDVCIAPLEHAGFVLGWDAKAFYVDPTYGGAVIADEARPALDDDTLPRANYILLTHAHADHLDSLAVSRLEEGVTIFGPPQVDARMPVNEVLREGDTRNLGSFGLTAVPMYNVSRGPAPGLVYHPRGGGIGYLLDLAGTHIYVSGDTDCTAEVRALRGVDVAIVAMDGRTTMSPGEAAQCLLEMRPHVVIPVHDWEADLGELRRALDGSGIELRELPFYPRPERLRVSAVRACDEGHWGRCVELLDLAQQLDPRSDQDPRVVRARGEALRRLNPLPFLH